MMRKTLTTFLLAALCALSFAQDRTGEMHPDFKVITDISR